MSHRIYRELPVPSLPGRYHSITLLKFMGLITDFFGGKARMLEVLSGEKLSPNPFPCCCCCCLPLLAINRYCTTETLCALTFNLWL